MTDRTPHESYVFIHRTMVDIYALGELRVLCGYLGVDAQDLPHETKSELAAALLGWADRRGPEKRAELLGYLREKRRDVAWPDDYAAPAGAGDPEPDRVPPPPPDPTGPLPEPGDLPPGSLIPYGRNPFFTGREAILRALAGLLLTTDHSPLTTILSGLGGVGKTQLAVEFAHRYGRFFQSVHWVSLADAGGVPAAVAECGRRMGLHPAFGGLALDDQVALTEQAWAGPARRLLIFDNGEDPALLERWRPKSGGARLLVTSRRERWPADLPVRVAHLGTMDELESVALLRRHLTEGGGRPPRADVADDDLRAIAAELGELPLALALAGRYLRRYGRVSPAGYLAELRRPALLRHASLRLEAGSGPSPTGHERDVWRTVALSYDRLRPDADDAPGNAATKATAAALLARAACFAPGEPLPEELLLAALVTEPATLADEGLERLLELGLLEPAAGAAGRVKLHRLIARFVEEEESSRQDAKGAKDAEEEDANEQRTMAARAVSISLADIAEKADRSGNLWSVTSWSMHLRHVTEMWLSHNDRTAARLCNAFADWLWLRGDFVASMRYTDRALTICESTLDEDDEVTSETLNNKGVLLKAIGDLSRARPYLERALAIRERVLGPDHPSTATSLNNLGGLLQAQGDLAGARPYYERALAVRERVLGPDHPSTATSLNNLGYLLQAQGDLAGARAYYERALAVSERVLGPDHPSTATSLNNLGYLLKAQGDLAGARPYYERALAVWERVLGPDHPDTATSLNNLGGLLQDLGDLAGARPYYERALAVRERVLGPDHPDTARSLNNLGSLLQAQGDLAGARPYFERALAVWERVLGPDHPDTATSLWWMGALAEEEGRRDEARDYYRRAQAVFLKVLGPDHPDTRGVTAYLEQLT